MIKKLIGRTLLKQFRIEELIGYGGMGVVYRVWDLKRNVYLAMKVLHADLADDPAMFKRFQREARALQKLAHPNIVPFYGLHKTNDLVFMLERFIDGSTLKDFLRLKPGQPMPIPEALVFLKAACAALGYAHANGVVHCDVKPANVMVDQGGNVYVTDFGIARHAESTTTTLASAGTPAYMTPEQIRGEAVTPATDVYALGVMLFEMLTGQRPFRGTESGTESAGATAGERIRYAHLHLPSPDPQALNPHISPSLAEVILRALEKVPTQRYQGAPDLYAAACTAIGASPTQVPDRLLAIKDLLDTDAQIGGEITEGNTSLQPVFSLGNRRLIFSLILVVVAALAITGLYLRLRASDWTAVISNQRAKRPNTTIKPASSTQTSSTPTVNSIGNAQNQPPTSMVATQDTRIPPATSPLPSLTATQVDRSEEIFINPIDNSKLVFIPAGEFLMGLNSADADYLYFLCGNECTSREIFDASQPLHTVYLDGYLIDRTEVSNDRYQKCVYAGACAPPHELSSNTRGAYYGNNTYNNYPVVWIDWSQANQFCLWANGTLPTEAQWEKAARGTDGRLFPWGNSLPNPRLTNVNMWVGDTQPIDSYPEGASTYGILNMAGNVYEWVSDWYEAQYYRNYDNWINPIGPLIPNPNNRRSIRGGNFSWGITFASTGIHDWWEANKSSNDVGFRCAYDVTIAGQSLLISDE